MVSFRPYPIVINGSQWDEFFLSMEKLLKTDRFRVSMIDGIAETLPDTSPAAKAYERSVLGTLQTVAKTRLGKLLLDWLPTTRRIWIVPYDSKNREEGIGCALTFPEVPASMGGGIRVAYSPDINKMPGCGLAVPDAALFHELVHAYRFARYGWNGTIHTPLPGYPDHEELLAVQMHNTFWSAQGKLWFSKSHLETKILPLDGMREHFRNHPAVWEAFSKFLNVDPFAMAVSKMPTPDFNPFREYRLSKMHSPNGKPMGSWP